MRFVIKVKAYGNKPIALSSVRKLYFCLSCGDDSCHLVKCFIFCVPLDQEGVVIVLQCFFRLCESKSICFFNSPKKALFHINMLQMIVIERMY